MIVLAAALQEAKDFSFIMFAGIIWLYTIVLVTETASLRSKWRQHAIPELSRLTRGGDPHLKRWVGMGTGIHETLTTTTIQRFNFTGTRNQKSILEERLKSSASLET